MIGGSGNVGGTDWGGWVAWRILRHIPQQKGRHFCRPSLLENRKQSRSVSRGNGWAAKAAKAAKAVVHALGDHIHVLADPIERTGNDRVGDRERIIRVAHKQVVVF